MGSHFSAERTSQQPTRTQLSYTRFVSQWGRSFGCCVAQHSNPHTLLHTIHAQDPASQGLSAQPLNPACESITHSIHSLRISAPDPKTHLMQVCLTYVANNLTAVLQTDGYKHMVASCPNMVSEVLAAVAAQGSQSMSSHRGAGVLMGGSRRISAPAPLPIPVMQHDDPRAAHQGRRLRQRRDGPADQQHAPQGGAPQQPQRPHALE